ncbi:MAG: hypothetical protein LBG60_16800 [Bifidobacteriaceae bacterium]|nr:hypothetical protein [Bifidobacteriaceae bacterium]
MKTTFDLQTVTALAVKDVRRKLTERQAGRLKALADKRAALAARIREIHRKIDEAIDTDAIGREVLLELVALQTSGEASGIDEAFKILAERYDPPAGRAGDGADSAILDATADDAAEDAGLEAEDAGFGAEGSAAFGSAAEDKLGFYPTNI